MNQTIKKEKKAWPWLIITILVIAIDQLSKYLAIQHLRRGEPIKLLPFFNLNLSYNPGAAFGFLGNARGWQVYFLSTFAIVVAMSLTIILFRLNQKKYLAAALSVMIGGALGNVIDRLHLSYVIDFLDFHIKQWHYPTFNLADSFICIDAFLLFIMGSLFCSRR